MQYSDRSNNLPMVRTIQDQERDTYHPNISVDSHRVSVRNGMRQKAGEIQEFRAFERGVEKWCREHIQRHETGPISEEGQNLLEDTDR